MMKSIKLNQLAGSAALFQIFPDGSTMVNSSMVPVPEPLTILGAGTAAGFGAFFKRQLNKQQKDKNKDKG